MRAGDVLHHPGDPVENVVFPHSGVVAMSVRLANKARAGALLVGRDGIIGGFAAVALAPAICEAEVHISGTASRMSAAAFRYVLDQSPAIRQLTARFDAAMLAQAQQTALCNAVHPVDARLCRWLLECQDRGGDGRVPLTQATLAQLLGVRRTTVTLMAGRLEAAGVLNCRRGALQIVNRNELQRRSCECYAHLKNYQNEVFGVSPEVLSSGSQPSAPVSPDEIPGWGEIRTVS
jgi:CRP-like cAMP-binding protein